jgi:hypothetical protein
VEPVGLLLEDILVLPLGPEPRQVEPPQELEPSFRQDSEPTLGVLLGLEPQRLVLLLVGRLVSPLGTGFRTDCLLLDSLSWFFLSYPL